MVIDWDKVEEENKSQYKEYAPEGNYTTKVKKVELVQSGVKKTPGLQFTFEDTDDYAFPRFGATHWLSFNKDNWRIHHFKELFIVLGLTEKQARDSVQQCEDKEEQSKIVEEYERLFKKAVKEKSGEIEVVVFKRTPDAQYNDCDFADNNVRMNRPEKKNKMEKVSDILEVGEEADDIDKSEIPF